MAITNMIEIAFKKLIADLQEQFQTIEEADDDDLLNKMISEASKKLAKKIQKESPESDKEPLEKKEKKAKKVKAKLTVYRLFCAKNRDSSMDFIKANSAVAAMWKALSDDEKAEFAVTVKDVIDADIIRFNEEKANLEDDTNDTNSPKKTKKAKDPNAPKRPLGSFMLFCKEKRENDPSVKGAEGTKRITEMWKSLKATDKQVYTDKAKKLMDEFKGIVSVDEDEECEDDVKEEKPVKEKKEEKKEKPVKEKKEKKNEKVEEDDN